jgi:hypothetical protein
MPAVCLYFTTYETSRNWLVEFERIGKSPFLAYFSSGLLAETVACAVFVPVDVIKERLQV